MVNYAGKLYEYVPKSELQPAKEGVEKIIKELQSRLRLCKVTFSFHLVGSAGRNLVTRVVGGNTGFDFDYNFSIQKDADLNAGELKHLFITKLNEVLESSPYKKAENNTQAITIKVVDTINKKIVHSCDFAIIKEFIDNDGDTHQKILIYNKLTTRYIWNVRPDSKNYSVKVSNLVANGLWVEVKDEYLKLKNNNRDQEKKSFSLYFEAVNNVYSKYNWI